MLLSTYGVEFYDPRPSIEPAVDAWEASFDGGATWIEQTLVGGFPAWLVAGPEADPGAAVAVLTDSVAPLLRAIDTPELIVREGPKIYVQ